MSDYVFVMGSKEPAYVHKKSPTVIYAANAAVERARQCEWIWGREVPINGVFSPVELAKVSTTRSAYIGANLDRLILTHPRNAMTVDMADVLKNEDAEKEHISETMTASKVFLEQMTGVYRPILKPLRTLALYRKNRRFWAAPNTGLWAVLLACHENPGLDVVVAGIGVFDGGRFDKVLSFQKKDIDKALWYSRRIAKNFQSNIYSTDETQINVCGMRRYRGETIPLDRYDQSAH